MLRTITIFVIFLFLWSSSFLLPGRVCADGVLDTILGLLEKSRNSNSPTVAKNKKDSKVKSATSDSSQKNGVVSPDDALTMDGYGAFKFGMDIDDIKKIVSCELEALPEEKGFIPGGEIFECDSFSFDYQPAAARFTFVDGAFMALKIGIPFDKKRLELLPKKYASRYGAPTFVSPKSDCEAWEKGTPYAEQRFRYSNDTLRLSFINNESGEHFVITIGYTCKKFIQLIAAADTEAAKVVKKEDAAVKLVADFTADPITGTCPLAVHFKNTSLGCKEGWWDFGDGENSVELNPTHVYKKPGTYRVQLVVGGKTTWSDAVKEVRVLAEKLVAEFVSVPTRGVAPLEVRFTDLSRGSHGKWHWDFGDGTESDQKSPNHVYNKPGTYIVSLTVKNVTIGAVATGTQNITDQSVEKREIIVFSSDAARDAKIEEGKPGKPIANFYPSPPRGIAPLEVRFYDNSVGSLEKWHWDFGDGSESDQQSPAHVYNKPGAYTVGLTVSNTTNQSVEKKDIVVSVDAQAAIADAARDAKLAEAAKIEEGLAELAAGAAREMKEIDDRLAAVERGRRGRSLPTKERVITEWWNTACKELMNTRKYFSEKEIYEVMFIISENAINQLDHTYKNKHNDQGWRDTCAAACLTAEEARDLIRYEYEQKSENPEFSKIK